MGNTHPFGVATALTQVVEVQVGVEYGSPKLTVWPVTGARRDVSNSAQPQLGQVPGLQVADEPGAHAPSTLPVKSEGSNTPRRSFADGTVIRPVSAPATCRVP